MGHFWHQWVTCGKWGHFCSLDLWLRQIGTLWTPVDDLWQMGTLLFSGSVAEVNRDTLCRPAENGDNCDHNSLWLLTNYPRHVLQTIGGWNAAWSSSCFDCRIRNQNFSNQNLSSSCYFCVLFWSIATRTRFNNTANAHTTNTIINNERGLIAHCFTTFLL